MRVDQAGQKRGVAEIDNFHSRRMSHRRAGFDDSVVFYQKFSGGDDLSCFDVEQTRGMQNGLVFGGWRSGMRSAGGREKDRRGQDCGREHTG